MIVGIGCDVVNHEITQGLGWSLNAHKLQRVLSSQELYLVPTNEAERFISGRFAAKEAVLKCLGTGMKDGISLTDIQILQNLEGKPIIQVDGEVKRIAIQLGIASWHISISHSYNSSIAFVVAESKIDK